jgi:hypothetical protein
MRRIEPLEKKEKRYPIGLSHSELVNIIWIDPKTGKKRIFKTNNIDFRNSSISQRDKESFFQHPLQ